MASDTLIPDDLLRALVGVGQVDVVVGIPTLNHAATIADLVHSVDASFRTFFARQRTVLINSDGGSSDGTPALVQGSGTDQARTLTASHGLRTMHRISTPYHGVPGKANAVRMIFAAAELLQAPVVVILDPDVVNVTPAWIAALALPVRDRRVDFVAPVYQREVGEGHLVTQLLRPLVRATYGWRIREPLAGEFACSGRLAAHCAEQDAWSSPVVQNGVNLWITGTALAGGFTSVQAALGPRQLAPGAPRPTLPEVFQQVVTTAFAMIDAHEAYWLTRTLTDDVPIVGTPASEAVPRDVAASDGARMLESFSEDVDNLGEILEVILTRETLSAVRAAAIDPAGARLSDALWAATVGEFLVAYHHNVMRRDHITQALLPLYVARTGTFLLEQAHRPPAAAEIALESLCGHFEQAKARVVDRWTQPAVR